MINEIKVLDHGYVKLRNIAGPFGEADDTDPANTARFSFDGADRGDRTREADLKLSEYLLKNGHCYHPDMQVLTIRGWLRWGDCNSEEVFLVPDPKTKVLHPERLEVIRYGVSNETMSCFKNNRMSYCVTGNHSMFFKGKYQSSYKKVEASSMLKWGHFQPSAGFTVSPDPIAPDPFFCLLGFYFGDGHNFSKNKVSFHLKKLRKIEYLKKLLDAIDVHYTVLKHDDGTTDIRFVKPPRFIQATDFTNKKLKLPLGEISTAALEGIFEGLVNSDGHKSKSRSNQIQFSSINPNILNLFETVSQMLGRDAHKVLPEEEDGVTRMNSYGGNRVSLESRKQYHSTKTYTGEVFCTTTSTGWLLVRGENTEFSFICGNSTPFEMIEVWLEMKMPLFIARQFVRHRTVSINEISARYVQLPNEFYVPKGTVVGEVSASNKQGRVVDGGVHGVDGKVYTFCAKLREKSEQAYASYSNAIKDGIPNELARCFLPVNVYTKWLWNQDLHNMMHFLSLRLHEHAQFEARMYAKAIYAILREQLPHTMDLFDKYRRKEG